MAARVFDRWVLKRHRDTQWSNLLFGSFVGRPRRALHGRITVVFSLLSLLAFVVGPLFLFDLAAAFFGCISILGQYHLPSLKVRVNTKKCTAALVRGSARSSFGRTEIATSPHSVVVSLVTSSATATATASVATTTAAATTATFRLGAGFVHGQRAAVVFGTVDAVDGRCRFAVTGHLDETEALASAGVAVIDDFGAFDCAELSEQLIEIIARDVKT